MITIQSTLDYDALVKEDRVHGDVYTRADIFTEEIAKIFYHGWVYVGHASEIPHPGDFRLGQIGLQSVIMTRDDDGAVHLLMNRCTHRANTICYAEHGNARTFRCAYHGWTFRNNGDLLGVTYAKRYDASFSKADYGLRHVPRLTMYRGFVFGSLNPDVIGLDDYLGEPVKPSLISSSTFPLRASWTYALASTSTAIMAIGSFNTKIPWTAIT